MDRKYRLEISRSGGGNPSYSLTKDFKVGGKKARVKKYLFSGPTPPSSQEIEQFKLKYARELELKAALKKAEMVATTYSIGYLPLEAIITLEQFKYLFQANKDLLTIDEVRAYEERFEMQYIHGTTVIEGNTLSFSEASNLLLYDVTPSEKSYLEMKAIDNFKKVVPYRNAYHGKVTLKFIKRLHALIMDGIISSAGEFRRADDLCIDGCDLRPSPSIEIETELTELINEYYRRLNEGRHPFEEAVLFHYNFELIHPFDNGNGRVGREVLNYMLVQKGFPRFLVLGEDREKYIKALHFGNNAQFDSMILHFARLMSEQRLSVLLERFKQDGSNVSKT